MRKNLAVLACFLQVMCAGCIDFVRLEDSAMVNASLNSAPIIDINNLSPHPAQLIEPVSVGKNCRGQVFKVPPIIDRGGTEPLYYLWFLDNKLVRPLASIEPEFRKSAILTLSIDEQFLMSHFETKIPKDFFNRAHYVEFRISKLRYIIPESKLTDDTSLNETDYGDYAYWIISFSNDSC